MTVTDTSGSVKAVRAFPAAFVWNAATVASRIDGVATSDRCDPSARQAVGRAPGRVRDGDTGEVACDFHNGGEGDLDLVAGSVACTA